jgi:hypothetical protein
LTLADTSWSPRRFTDVVDDDVDEDDAAGAVALLFNSELLTGLRSLLRTGPEINQETMIKITEFV